MLQKVIWKTKRRINNKNLSIPLEDEKQYILKICDPYCASLGQRSNSNAYKVCSKFNLFWIYQIHIWLCYWSENGMLMTSYNHIYVLFNTIRLKLPSHLFKTTPIHISYASSHFISLLSSFNRELYALESSRSIIPYATYVVTPYILIDINCNDSIYNLHEQLIKLEKSKSKSEPKPKPKPLSIYVT